MPPQPPGWVVGSIGPQSAGAYPASPASVPKSAKKVNAASAGAATATTIESQARNVILLFIVLHRFLHELSVQYTIQAKMSSTKSSTAWSSGLFEHIHRLARVQTVSPHIHCGGLGHRHTIHRSKCKCWFAAITPQRNRLCHNRKNAPKSA